MSLSGWTNATSHQSFWNRRLWGITSVEQRQFNKCDRTEKKLSTQKANQMNC